jgi:hypothetical protein
MDVLGIDVKNGFEEFGRNLQEQKESLNKLDKAAYFHYLEREVGSILSLMKNKNKDYTAGGGPFANFEQAKDFGVEPLLGLSLRLGDKFKRVQSYFKNESLSVKSEGIEDAYRDIIGYSLIALAMLHEKKLQGK